MNLPYLENIEIFFKHWALMITDVYTLQTQTYFKNQPVHIMKKKKEKLCVLIEFLSCEYFLVDSTFTYHSHCPDKEGYTVLWCVVDVHFWNV